MEKRWENKMSKWDSDQENNSNKDDREQGSKEQYSVWWPWLRVPVVEVQLNAHCCYWYTSVLVTQESIASLRKAEQESKIISRLPT